MEHTRLGECLRIYRVLHNQEQRTLATEIGMNASSLCRLEQGKLVDAQTLVKIMAWLLGPADAYGPQR